MNELRFDGRVAVVTGGGRGIGREHALLLAARGARVVVNDWGRSPDGKVSESSAADDVVAEIRAARGVAVADASDVGTPDGAAAPVDRALAEWSRVDIVINNAGTFRRAPDPGAMTDADIDVVIRTHLLATIWTCRRAWPHMVAAGYGRIVNTSSSTMLGVVNSWDYPAAKGGVLGFSRSLAVTGAPHNIAVNAIMPMAYTRPMHTYPDAAIRDWMAQSFPAASVAPMVAFLAHDSVPCSGETFAVGAGRCARVVMQAAPGYQRLDGPLALEDVRDHFAEIMDISAPVLLRHSRDESMLYRGNTRWTGPNDRYESE